MFKKTEESEWSRFSRVLGGQPKSSPEETPAKEAAPEPVPAAREVSEPAPVPAATVAAPRPTPPSQPYSRAHSNAPQEPEDVETVIGTRTSIEGTLNCESNMRIKGSAQGEIHCTKSIIIEESARVNAKVTAANAVVAGKVDGSIVCEGRLEVLATGQVTGELTASVLIIQEGAFFEGHLKMKDRQPGVSATDAARNFGVSGSESA